MRESRQKQLRRLRFAQGDGDVAGKAAPLGATTRIAVILPDAEKQCRKRNGKTRVYPKRGTRDSEQQRIYERT